MAAREKQKARAAGLSGHWLAWLVLLAAIVLPLAMAGFRFLTASDSNKLMDDPHFVVMILTAIVAAFALLLAVMIRFAPGGISGVVWAVAILLVWGVGSVAYVLLFEAH